MVNLATTFCVVNELVRNVQFLCVNNYRNIDTLHNASSGNLALYNFPLN